MSSGGSCGHGKEAGDAKDAKGTEHVGDVASIGKISKVTTAWTPDRLGSGRVNLNHDCLNRNRVIIERVNGVMEGMGSRAATNFLSI